MEINLYKLYIKIIKRIVNRFVIFSDLVCKIENVLIKFSIKPNFFKATMFFLASDGKAAVPSLKVLAAAAVPRNCSHLLERSLQHLPAIVKHAFGITSGRYEIQKSNNYAFSILVINYNKIVLVEIQNTHYHFIIMTTH